MKRLLLITLLLMCLTGCEDVNTTSIPAQADYDVTFNLVSDPQTNIIYIKSQAYNDYVYTPYYSKNGKLCRYVDGEIKEIDNEY